jgi:hypothetical protein
MIQSIFEESKKFEYPGFKLFDKTIRLEKEYCLSDYQIWSDIGWVDIKKVIRHKCEKKMYRVLTHTGCIDVTEDHSLITENKEPIKPVDLKVGDSLLHSFPKEFNNKITFSIKNLERQVFDDKLSAQRAFYLFTSYGNNIYIKMEGDKFILEPKNNSETYSNDIINIECLRSKYDYVYDIETEIGRFGAGVGQLQCYNTDSVFLSLKYNRQDFNKNRQDSFNLATICGENITKMFNRNPIDLEFEKVFQPFILLTKKRYIGKKYENTKDPFKLKEITKSGIAITRRDYCKMVKNCYTEVIDCIVNEDGGGVNNSVEIYKSYVDRIDNYQIDIEDLVVSAMLAKSYKTRPVHVQLADKLKERHEEVQVGSRIGYIYIENTTGEPKQKSELGEDPIYAKKHNLKYNRGCYLSQLAKPLLSFFKVVFNENSQSELDELIEYTNNKLEEYDGKGARLRPSDYKLDE